MNLIDNYDRALQKIVRQFWLMIYALDSKINDASRFQIWHYATHSLNEKSKLILVFLDELKRLTIRNTNIPDSDIHITLVWNLLPCSEF